MPLSSISLSQSVKSTPMSRLEDPPQRASLAASFRNSQTECLLDGFLVSATTFHTQAIIEAEASFRADHSPDVFVGFWNLCIR